MTEKSELSRWYLELLNPKINTSSIVNRKIKKFKHDLDIIIPCYNVEKYIRRCVESVCIQKSRYDLHIILVDDGSTDETSLIIEEYENNRDITVIRQENTGASGARNTGLMNVNSKYVTFIDADDYLAEQSIDKMLDAAFEFNADIVEGNIVSFEEQNNNIEVNEFSSDIKKVSRKDISGYAWGKIIRSDLFDNVIFPEGYWFEDGIISYLILPRSEKNYRIDLSFYFYRHNIEGISARSKGNPKSIDAYWLREILFNDMDKLGIEINQELYELIIEEIALTFVRTYDLDMNVKVSIFYLTLEWFKPLHDKFNSRVRLHAILEKGLELENYQTYADGCAILWNSKT